VVAPGKPEVRSTNGKCRGGSTRVVTSTRLALLSSLFSLVLLIGCPGEDITPPNVSIIVPADGDTLTGSVTIQARATDNRGVTRVDFFVDGALIGTDATPTGNVYEYAWLGVLRPGSSHTLSCTATDAAGNRGASPAVTVYISSSAGTHHSGIISAAETWTAAQSPHVIDDDLFVEATLTLEPGAVVLVADAKTIAVGTHGAGAIVARGRPDSLTTISALSTSPAPGAWAGIQFRGHAAAGVSIFRHCRVEYAGSGGALIQCSAGSVNVDSSELRQSSGSGVAASGDGLGSLSHNTLSACARFPVSVSPGLVSALGTANILTDNYRDAFEIPGGTVSATDTWPDLGAPYAITATVTVADSTNPLLEIAPGCSLLFADSALLRVGLGKPGALRADGTYGRVVFGPLAAGPGHWGGLEFWEKTDEIRTILNFCDIEGAGAGNSAAINCYSEVLIANTRIADNAGTGIDCHNTGFARFENDTITGCGSFPVQIAAPYVGTIGTGNNFTGNSRNAIAVTGGTIAGNTQFRLQDVPYLILETIEVSSALEPTLVFDNGVELQFDSLAALAVGRSSRASVQADSVTFTGAAGRAGFWNGLKLYSGTTSTSRIERCRILYGGGDGYGIVLIDSCLPILTGNEIAFSSNYCVFIQNTDLDPDSVRSDNWLHDWNPDFDDIYYAP
jgi:hypothetical protein